MEWLRQAAEKAAEINQRLLPDVEVTSVQLDELCAFALRKHAAEAAENGDGTEQNREFVSTAKRGRARKPVVEPHPELVYTQLVKQNRS